MKGEINSDTHFVPEIVWIGAKLGVSSFPPIAEIAAAEGVLVSGSLST